MLQGTAYRIANYGGMIRDRVRTDAYVEALRRGVSEGCTVLDIGTGTGILAMLACRFGARRVYAVEPNEAIHLAREIAAANGYADRITFIQGLSTQLTLPEQVDVVVCDLRGALPLFQMAIPSIADARKRHLAPGGKLIPRRDTLWAAAVEAPEVYRNYTAPWGEHPYGFDMTAGLQVMLNVWGKGQISPEAFLVEPAAWAELDYHAVTEPDVVAEIAWRAARPGVGHGVNVWFDAELMEGVRFSTAPGGPQTVYGSASFPGSSR